MQARNVEMYINTLNISNNLGQSTGAYALLLKYKNNITEYNYAMPNSLIEDLQLNAIATGLEFYNQPCNVDIYTTSSFFKKVLDTNLIKRYELANFKDINNNDILHKRIWQSISASLKTHTINKITIDYNKAYILRCKELCIEAINELLDE